jgi:rhodanese-related sulfurtransferase
MASHDAARRAVKLGYAKVYVMPDGIDGWVKAGKKVEAGAR